jgi:hypothetical protein
MKITRENMKKVLNETYIYFITYLDNIDMSGHGQLKNGIITQHPFTFQSNNPSIVVSNYLKITREEKKDYVSDYE